LKLLYSAKIVSIPPRQRFLLGFLALKKLVKKNMFFYLEDKKRKNQAPV